MKILNVEQIRALDAYTIQQESIPSIALMERASETFATWFQANFPNEDQRVCIFCGIGNNGGDGLAIARLLRDQFYEVEVFICEISTNYSPDFQTNLQRLRKLGGVSIHYLTEGSFFPILPEKYLIVDAIFGSGLNRAVEGYWATLLEFLNTQKSLRIAVDVPSGLFADTRTEGLSVHADFTFSFELPKLAFLFPENQQKVGEWVTKSIGLSTDFIQDASTDFYFIDQHIAHQLLRKRGKYDHKGTFGHALLVAGSYGKVGAATLAAKACLRSGAGLVSVHAPRSAYQILQIGFPEAMVSVDEHDFCITHIENIEPYKSIGVGCGIGTNTLTVNALSNLLDRVKVPLVLDADALNILAQHPTFFQKLPHSSILTPHPKEFERLFGTAQNDFERNQLQRAQAQKLGVYIILKGANTCIATPEGICYFNSTGNPGMATGGSGDVLTGLITGLLAQGYSSFDASILGVYLHGLAGDLAAGALQQEALLASDIIQYLGKAFLKMRS